MAHGSRVCPNCGRLTAVEDKACIHCGKGLPGPLTSSAIGFLSDFSADGLPATKLMAGICILVYGLMMATDLAAGVAPGRVILGFQPSTFIRFGQLLGPIISIEPWRVLSAVFVHGNLIHLGVNMLSLLNLGRTLEPHFRSSRFLLLYLLSGIVGFCTTVWQMGLYARSVGASGAIFGLLGAFIGALIVRRNPGWQRVFMSNLIMAFALAYFVPNIDNWAHGGGFVVGVVLGIALELERQPRRRDRLMTGLAALGVVAAVASIILSASSPAWKVMKRHEQRVVEEQELDRFKSE
jgi:rhomboid protease GluP